MRSASGSTGLSPWTMVRNFHTTNGSPARPTRAWRNSTGPDDVHRTATATTAPTSSAGGVATTASTRSTTRFPR